MCIDYKQGKIFKLTSYQTPNIFIGGTVQRLSQKLAKFRKDYKLYLDTNKDIKYYHPAFKMFRYDRVKIVLIEPCPCNNKDELDGKIYEHVDNMECINKKHDKYDDAKHKNKKKRGPIKKKVVITETEQRTEQPTNKKYKQTGGDSNNLFINSNEKTPFTNNLSRSSGVYNFLEDTETDTEFNLTDSEAEPQHTQKPIKSKSTYCKCGEIYKTKHEKAHLLSRSHLDKIQKQQFNNRFTSAQTTDNLSDLSTTSYKI